MEEEYEVRSLDELYGHLERLREEKGVRWLDIGRALDRAINSARDLIRFKRNAHFCTIGIILETFGYGLYVNDIYVGRCVYFSDFVKSRVSEIPASDVFKNKKTYEYFGEAVFGNEVKINIGGVLSILEDLNNVLKIKKHEQI